MGDAAKSSRKVCAFGLGSMGFGIARSALRSGHMVWGIDVDPTRAARFQSEGGQASDIATSAKAFEVVIIAVLNAKQTEDVLFGKNGIVSHLKPGAVVLACATVPPAFARDMAKRCQDQGVHYLDAPISGGSKKAASGQLTVMASGAPEAFQAARPILDSIAETVFDLGAVAGAASAMKAVNQLLAGVHIATMAEALAFGMTQDISPEKFLEVIPKCAGSSWMLENRAPHVVAGDYTPHSSVNIWPKDLGIVLEIAKSTGFQAPLTHAALERFAAAAEMGFGREDDAAVAKVYAKEAGLKLPGAE